MARERWIIDNLEITEGLVRDWEVREGTDEFAGLVGQDVDIPNRDGQLWRPRTLPAATFTLNLWVRGDNPEEVRNNWNLILRAAVRRNRLVRIHRYLPDGMRIQCDASLIGQVRPIFVGQTVRKGSLTFTIPEGRWLSYDTFSQETPAGSQTSRELELTEFAASTAPLNLTYWIYGQCTNPRVYDETDPSVYAPVSYFEYKGTVPAGAYLAVNTASWEVTGSGFNPVKSALHWTGNARYLSLEPARPGEVPKVRLVCSSPSSTVKLRVNGRLAFLF